MAKCSVNWNYVLWQEPGHSRSVNSDFAIHHLLLFFVCLFFAIIIWCLAKVKQNLLGPGWQIQHCQNLWAICICELGFLSLMRLWWLHGIPPTAGFPSVSFNKPGILWALCRACVCTMAHKSISNPQGSRLMQEGNGKAQTDLFPKCNNDCDCAPVLLGKGTFPLQITSVR